MRRTDLQKRSQSQNTKIKLGVAATIVGHGMGYRRDRRANVSFVKDSFLCAPSALTHVINCFPGPPLQPRLNSCRPFGRESRQTLERPSGRFSSFKQRTHIQAAQYSNTPILHYSNTPLLQMLRNSALKRHDLTNRFTFRQPVECLV